MPSDIEKFVEAIEAETTQEEAESAENTTEEATVESLVTEVDTETTKTEKTTETVDKKKQFHLNVYDFVSIIMAAFIIIALVLIFIMVL